MEAKRNKDWGRKMTTLSEMEQTSTDTNQFIWSVRAKQLKLYYIKRAISGAQGSLLCEGWGKGRLSYATFSLLFAKRLFPRLEHVRPFGHKGATLLLLPRFALKYMTQTLLYDPIKYSSSKLVD